ncbi:TPA: membrane protein insertion efficiency factor YidD, partial [Listeria monocytogenes]
FHKGGLDFVPPKKEKNADSEHSCKAHHHH